MKKRLRDQDLTEKPRILVEGDRRRYSGLLYKVEAIDAETGETLRQYGNHRTCLYWSNLWAQNNEAVHSMRLAA